jgi:hypothetical protein
LKPAKETPETSAQNFAQAIEEACFLGVSEGAAKSAPALYIGAGHTASPGRGGHRNHADRRTTALAERQAVELLEAARFAVASGMAFNRFTTIHWQAAGVGDALTATGAFLKKLGDAVRASGSRFAYLWVREAGAEKGEHVHILWHGPADFPTFGRRVRDWLKACGAGRAKGVCMTRHVGRTLRGAMSGGDDYGVNLLEVLDYVLKGADAVARESLGVRRREPGGEIIGKRCGTSANIGRAARQEAVKAGSRLGVGSHRLRAQRSGAGLV